MEYATEKHFLKVGKIEREMGIIGNCQKQEETSNYRGESRSFEKDAEDDKGDTNESPNSEINETHVLEQAIQQLYNDPSFAVICSFFNKFAVFLGLKPQGFAKIESMFTSFHETGKVDRDLIDLHLTLLRKLAFKSARMEVWEKYLLKFCSIIPSLESEYLQLERYGYLHTTASTKLAIFKALCESQFDFNLKFKESLFNSCSANDLRLLPVGYDKQGLAYWYQQDADLFIRVYSSEQDDQSGGTWNLVAKSKEELENLVTVLKTRIASKYLCTLQKHREDSVSCSAALAVDETTKLAKSFFTKRGSLLDTYQDESAVKKKAVKLSRTRKKATVEEESKKENSAPPVAEDIPDEVKPFLDRRILPRRSARNAAINHLKELTTPLRSYSERRKNYQGMRKVQDEQVENQKQSRVRNKNDNDSDNAIGYDGDDDEIGKIDGDDDIDDFILAENSSTSSDDEFMPLSEFRKRNQNSSRRYRGRKLNLEKDLFEVVESEEDNDSDEDEGKKARKERKKATEETLCMKCNESSNPEVLLLCDLCDEAWHTWCLHPMLWFVPDDDWFCPNCHQAMLIERFSDVLVTLAEQLKQKAAEDKKKEAAAERLKREMEYIGVSLNNIIETVTKIKDESSSLSEDPSENAGERKSKKKAIRRLGIRSQKSVLPIALSRSRRHVAKVDYNFGAYDELIQEAVKNMDESAARQMSSAGGRPKGGVGRGKDIANIMDAEKKTSFEINDNCKDVSGERMHFKVDKPIRSRHRLNDLNVDEMTESDTDEYQASENASVSDPSDDTDEYVPSDSSVLRRGVKRRHYSIKRTQSDDDFIVSDSESEFEPSKKRSRQFKNSKKTKGQRKRGRWVSSDEDSTFEASDNYESGESDSSRFRNARRRAASKWSPRATSSEADDSDHLVQKTATGRPLRKAVVMKHSITVDDDDDDDYDEQRERKEEEELVTRKEDVRSVHKGRKIESSDEFEPDEDEEEEEDEETVVDEEIENKEKTTTVRNNEEKEQADEKEIEAKECEELGKKIDSKDVQEPLSNAADLADMKIQTEVTDRAVEEVKTEAEKEVEFVNDTKFGTKIVKIKSEEKSVNLADSVAPCMVATSYVSPPCLPSTSPKFSSLNLSSVMEQMAKLASSPSSVRQFNPANTTYQALQTAAPVFINSGTSPIYPIPVPVTVYQMAQPTLMRTIQSGIGTMSQGWPPYPSPSPFSTNVASPSVVVSTTTAALSATDSETLGNALASAMDY